MSNIPIIGQTPVTPELTKEQEDMLAKMAEEHPPVEEPGNQVTTAFIIAIGLDGAVIATHDLRAPFYPQRPATTDDMYAASAVVQKDILAMETAARTQQQMLAAGRAMQAQAQEAQIRQRLNIG
jgi:hypothetical protein